MNKKLGKVVMLGCMTAATLATAVSSTFAFVTMNQEAKVSEFDFDIETQEGLLISLDGKNFYQDISYEMITKAIEYNVNGTYSQYLYKDKTTGEYTLDATNAEEKDGTPVNYAKKFSDLKFTPVTIDAESVTDYERNADGTPKEDTANPGTYLTKTFNGAKYIDYKYAIGGDVFTSTTTATDKRLKFVKDALDETVVDPSGLNDVWYGHKMVDAYSTNDNKVTSGDYIYFDLWFTVATNGITDAADAPTYKLKMKNDADRPMFEGTETEAPLYNDLTTQTKTYHAGEKITVNTADAMRLAIVTQGKVISPTDTTRPGLYVYEPTKTTGLGSVAVNNVPAYITNPDAYDPTKNAMYTYYNATHPLSPFTKAADWNESFDTKDEYYNDIYATLNYHPAVAGTNSLASYDVVKLSVAIWLEGWDADYYMGISANSVKVKLGFEVVAEE